MSAAPATRLGSVLFALSAVAMLLLAFLTYQSLRDQERLSVQTQLRVIGEARKERLESWLEERRGDALYVSRDSRLAGLFAAWLKGDRARSGAGMLEQFQRLRQAHGYEGISLFDPSGRCRFGAGPLHDMHEHSKEALTAQHQGEPVLVDLHTHADQPTKIRMGMMAPLILGEGAHGRTIGAIYLVMDAERTLFPLLRNWPYASRTGEWVLARREGGQLHFLITHKLASMSLVAPISSRYLPAARALRGERGIIKDARDYVGAPVLAYATTIAGTPWVLVAKQDQTEVDAPLLRLAYTVLAATSLLLTLIALSYWLWWRSQTSRFQARLLSKELERAELEQRFAMLTRYANDAIFISDLHGLILDCNERAAELYAIPRAQLLGRSLAELCEEQAVFVTRIQDMLARQERQLFEASHRRGDGGVFPVEVSAAVSAVQGVRHIHLIIRDISERKRIEAALRMAQMRFQRLVDANVVGVVIATPQGGILQANDYYLGLLGATREEFDSGRVNWIEVTPQEWLASDEKAIAELREHGICTPYEKEYQRRDGSRVAVFLADAMLPGPEQEIIAICIDISERKRAETKLAHYQESLEAEVRQRTAALETANRDLENFSYSVSHDLRAPLRAIDGFVGILLEDYAPRLDAEGLRLFGVVQENARKMGQLIDDILAFSRAGRLELERVEVDMNALVDEVWTSLRGDDMETEFVRTELPRVLADPRALRQVWQNLLENAHKFSRVRHPARVEVSARREGGRICYTVADNGVGFNPEYAGKLFGLFQRLHGMDEFAGTGVGLAIVKRYIQKHGGAVMATAVVDGGARFCFCLPESPGQGGRDGDQ